MNTTLILSIVLILLAINNLIIAEENYCNTLIHFYRDVPCVEQQGKIYEDYVKDQPQWCKDRLYSRIPKCE